MDSNIIEIVLAIQKIAGSGANNVLNDLSKLELIQQIILIRY